MLINVDDVYGSVIPGQNVAIQITEVAGSDLKAKVIQLDNFFSADRIEEGFVLGETLILRYHQSSRSWTITEPKNRPWHSLDGVRFEHYR